MPIDTPEIIVDRGRLRRAISAARARSHPHWHSGRVLANAELVAFLPTTNLDRTRVFFTETLGLSIIESTSFACVFDAHGTAVRVALVEEVQPAPYTVLGWVVNDLAAAVRGLAARGVSFERFPAMDQDELDIWTTPGGDRVAWFKDTEVNVLSLTQFARVAT